MSGSHAVLHSGRYALHACTCPVLHFIAFMLSHIVGPPLSHNHTLWTHLGSTTFQYISPGVETRYGKSRNLITTTSSSVCFCPA